MNIGLGDSVNKKDITTEDIFLDLYSDIISMRLKPGTKISEAEIAKLYDVSRHRVRAAFMRLGELQLLQIIPQKATLVPKISIETLENSRFIRAAIEVELIGRACSAASKEDIDALEASLERQKKAIADENPLLFHQLDYEFHRLICIAADCLPAFRTISENKAHSDRVCALELADDLGMKEVFEGHSNIVRAISQKDIEAAVKHTRHHLTHLDGTLSRAREMYSEFFGE